MGSLKLESYFLLKQRHIKKYGERTCVSDYARNQLQAKSGFKVIITCKKSKKKYTICGRKRIQY